MNKRFIQNHGLRLILCTSSSSSVITSYSYSSLQRKEREPLPKKHSTHQLIPPFILNKNPNPAKEPIIQQFVGPVTYNSSQPNIVVHNFLLRLAKVQLHLYLWSLLSWYRLSRTLPHWTPILHGRATPHIPGIPTVL